MKHRDFYALKESDFILHNVHGKGKVVTNHADSESNIDVHFPTHPGRHVAFTASFWIADRKLFSRCLDVSAKGLSKEESQELRFQLIRKILDLPPDLLPIVERFLSIDSETLHKVLGSL